MLYFFTIKHSFSDNKLHPAHIVLNIKKIKKINIKLSNIRSWKTST